MSVGRAGGGVSAGLAVDFGSVRPPQLVVGTGGDNLEGKPKASVIGADINGGKVVNAKTESDFGYMVWDTLFALDDKLQVQPEMVDKWEVSPDKLTWTFTLRDGLVWSDGAPVTSED